MKPVSPDSLRLILNQQQADPDDGSGDVVFALFLEPHEAEMKTLFDHVVSYVVSHFQPSPCMVHVELVVPTALSSRQPVNFATYIGSHSGWQTDKRNNSNYYLSSTANKWRAIPVFGQHAARRVRAACGKSENVKYSLFRYVTAAWGVRKLAAAVPDGPQDPAHCATLAARVLRAGGVPIRHHSAYYGPSSLYRELRDELAERNVVPDTTDAGAVAAHVDRLLRSRDADVASMREEDALAAIRSLTLRASAAEAAGDDAMATLTQKQLATGLLRWYVLKTS